MTQSETVKNDPARAVRIAGCLLGGAVGDALGGAIEFTPLERIRQRFGPEGVTGFEDYCKAGIRGVGLITDDTQMTLFTAEGLLRGYAQQREKGTGNIPTAIYRAYLRWLDTQGEDSGLEGKNDGWLFQVSDLHACRAPGNTCLSALESDRMGTVEEPINNSKGCGGVMRAAPVGLATFVDDPFKLGMEAAAITHGHPTGYLTAGCLAQVIHDLVEGNMLVGALNHAISILQEYPDHKETLSSLRHAIQLWEEDRGEGATPERVEQLGQGWVAEEALAIGVYCALAAGADFATGIRLAVNHSGDSDSTGSIAGNILGALLGKNAIPGEWLSQLELREVIEEIANDLSTGFQESPDGQISIRVGRGNQINEVPKTRSGICWEPLRATSSDRFMKAIISRRQISRSFLRAAALPTIRF